MKIIVISSILVQNGGLGRLRSKSSLHWDWSYDDVWLDALVAARWVSNKVRSALDSLRSVRTN